MFWFQRRSVEELSSTANADSAAESDADSADHLYSRHSNNSDSAGSENADAVAKTPKSDAEDLY